MSVLYSTNDRQGSIKRFLFVDEPIHHQNPLGPAVGAAALLGPPQPNNWNDPPFIEILNMKRCVL